jgi:hypothetical protein
MTTLTRAGMLIQIQADTGRSAAAQVTAMGLAIDSAIRFYQPKRFWFNETRSATFNTVAGTDFYAFNTATTTGAIPYEFYKIDGLWITFGTGDVEELDQADYSDFEEAADSQTTNNKPSQWAYVAKGIRFDYAPDAVYAVRIAGHYKLAAPASDAEADNPWMTEAYDLIMARTKGMLYANRWEDYVAATAQQQLEALALRALQDATVDKLRTGFVTPTDF